MEWKEITLTTSHEALDAGANLFFEVGAQGVVIEDPYVLDRYIREDLWDYYDLPLALIAEDCVVIKGYLPADESFGGRIDSFEEKLKWLQQCFPDCPADFSTKEINDEDWASSWKQFYKTSKIGSRVVVKPEWEEYTPAEGEIVIEMDPGAAFGTGTHGTTIMCVQLLEKYLVPGQMVFDVGCGSGILSVVAAKLGASFVFARDIDPAAVHATRKNADLNRVTPLVEAEAGNYLNEVPGKAHLIVCNIVSDAIIEFSPQAFERLLPGGRFIISGIIADRSEEVKERILASGFSVLEIAARDELVAMAAQKG